jgi:REP element-mobilizing transposase RayT
MMGQPERKSLRLKEYDYSQNGAYFVTICTAGKKKVLPNLIQGFKSAATRRYNLLVSPAERNKLWQGSYYDEIIRNEAHYLKAAQYILDNPAKWATDEYYCA